jgi:hypothetical protein
MDSADFSHDKTDEISKALHLNFDAWWYKFDKNQELTGKNLRQEAKGLALSWHYSLNWSWGIIGNLIQINFDLCDLER